MRMYMYKHKYTLYTRVQVNNSKVRSIVKRRGRGIFIWSRRRVAPSPFTITGAERRKGFRRRHVSSVSVLIVARIIRRTTRDVDTHLHAAVF